MQPAPSYPLTPDEYLAWERRATSRSEWVGRRILAMAGASYEHNLIVANVLGEFYRQLKGRSCAALPSDMRLKVPDGPSFTYPDVMVLCQPPQWDDAQHDTLLNPTLIVEVLSPSTAGYDRGDKFALYQQLPSLEEYVLIAQDKPRVEHYRQQSAMLWLLTIVEGRDQALTLPTVGCTLALADVYDRVVWEPIPSPVI